MKNFKPPILIFILLLLGGESLFAHVSHDDYENLSGTQAGWMYFKLGFTHIIPDGFDHILFILALYLLNSRMSAVLYQATAFTIAHSITLGLAMFGYIQPLSNVIEPIIALSILFIAVENIFTRELKHWRILVVFIFGLIHGLGFAGALSEVGLPAQNFLLALVTFNAGVEAGQITVILLAFSLFGFWFSKRPWYHRRIVVPLSIAIGSVAVYWVIIRTI